MCFALARIGAGGQRVENAAQKYLTSRAQSLTKGPSVTKIEKRKEQAKPTKPSAIPKSAVGRGVNLNLIFETE